MNIRSVEYTDILELKSVWLEKENKIDNLFLTYEWNYSWIKGFNPKEIKIYVVYKNDNVAAIIPFFIRKVGFIKFYSFLADNISDYNDIILFDENQNVKDEIINIFNKIKNKIFTFLLFRNIAFESVIYNLLIDKKDSYNNIIFSNTIVATNKKDYLINNCKKKQVSNAKRLYKRMNESYCIQYEQNIISDSRLEELINYKRANLKEKKKKSILFDESYSKFMKIFIDIGMKYVRLSSIYSENTFVSGSLDFIYKNKFYYYMPGYNPEFYKYSPSSIILYNNLDNLNNAESIKYIDFLKGDEEYKNIWAIEHKNVDLFIFSDFPFLDLIKKIKKNNLFEFILKKI